MIDLAPPPVPKTPDPPAEQSDGSKIIDMRGGPLEIQETSKDKPRTFCAGYCKHIEVDEFERLIHCRDCGKTMDPFDYLLRWAREGGHRMSRLKDLDVEIRKKHAELEIVKQALAREKSKVRRINPDAPEVVTWRRQIEKMGYKKES